MYKLRGPNISQYSSSNRALNRFLDGLISCELIHCLNSLSCIISLSSIL